MLVYIYIASIILTLMSFGGAMFSLKKYLSAKYSKEQLDFSIIKGSDINPFMIVLVFTLPLVNILFMLMFSFGYESIRDRIDKEIEAKIRKSEYEKNQLNEVKEVLSKYGIDVKDEKDNFKYMDEVLDEISMKLDEIRKNDGLYKYKLIKDFVNKNKIKY